MVEDVCAEVAFRPDVDLEAIDRDQIMALLKSEISNSIQSVLGSSTEFQTMQTADTYHVLIENISVGELYSIRAALHTLDHFEVLTDDLEPSWFGSVDPTEYRDDFDTTSNTLRDVLHGAPRAYSLEGFLKTFREN